MTPVEYHGGKVRLYPGDCLATLKGLPSDSVDAVVTDPPYALVSIVKRFGKDGAAPAQGDVYARASAGFMGQAWDTGETAFAVDFWREVYRVLKPGGHVAAFGGTRTCHHLTTAIEGAGFEIRDRLTWIICADTHVAQFLASLSEEQQRAFVRCIEESQFSGELAWIFGSGFPKSHDVAKGIDKRRDDRPAIHAVTVYLADAADRAGLTRAEVDAHMGTSDMAGWWLSRLAHRCQCPTWEQWAQLKAFLRAGDTMDAEVWRLNGRKGWPGEAWQDAEVIGSETKARSSAGSSALPTCGADTVYQSWDLKAPNSDDARQWQGWGTALKPALEPICLARKPLVGTVAENVLAHGTGAINVDACRVEGEGNKTFLARGQDGRREQYRTGTASGCVPSDLGRWPANVLHDGSHEVLAAFPQSVSGGGTVTRRSDFEGIAGNEGGSFAQRAGKTWNVPEDSCSAARFFYSAKADADDRIGSKHPTVKPVDLMRWLVRLICPPGGTVLDPFAGTGTTGEAAFREGFSAVLCEREPAYLLDIARRMDLVTAGPAIRRAERAKARAKTPKPAPLFGES